MLGFKRMEVNRQTFVSLTEKQKKDEHINQHYLLQFYSANGKVMLYL